MPGLTVLHRRYQVLPVVLLTLAWVVLWGSVSVGTVLLGVGLSLLMLTLYPLPRIEGPLTLRPWRFVILVAAFVRDLVRACLQIGWYVLTGRELHPALVIIRFRSHDELFQSVTAMMLTLVPGTIVLDLDHETGVMRVHALGVQSEADAERVVDECLGQEERLLRALARDTSVLRYGTVVGHCDETERAADLPELEVACVPGPEEGRHG